MTEVLHTKYRPSLFKEVVGQDAVVSSLSKIIGRDGSHAFLFSGPSGCGKTTLAYICAKKIGCGEKDILDIDAATYTGIDSMREVQNLTQYRPFGQSESRAVIIDECHALSKPSWQALLKAIENPPSHVYWFFCTTETAKVPDTIKTRCTSFVLKEVGSVDLQRVLHKVCMAEDIDLEPSIADLIIREARGSPRRLLVNLEKCRDCTDRKTAAAILQTIEEGNEAVLKLCRFLMDGSGAWQSAMEIVDEIGDTHPESVRIQISNYFAKVAKGAKTDKKAGHALTVLQAFSEPYTTSDKLAPLLLSLGDVLLSVD